MTILLAFYDHGMGLEPDGLVIFGPVFLLESPCQNLGIQAWSNGDLGNTDWFFLGGSGDNWNRVIS